MKLFTFFFVLFLSPFFLTVSNSPQTLPFFQDWSNIGMITANDDWAGVPGILGYSGDGLATGTGADPQLVVADGTSTPVDVNANQTNPNTFTTGGVTEFHITDPVVALAGSGTAKAPFILIHLNTTGSSNINVSYNLRDIDGSTDNAVQPVALQYRVGNTGDFTNLPAGFVADATSGPSLATLVTPVSVTLPAAADNQPEVHVRIITTDATGNDEWVGIDDISIMGGMVASCMISSVTTSNISACDDNGTPDPSDDFFTADVTVAFSNAPATGMLNLTGDGSATVSVVGLTNPHTFIGVEMSADGTDIDLTAQFSNEPTCTFTNSMAGTAPSSCSIAVPDCDISAISVGNISACNDDGTADPSDDFFTADVTVFYSNPPLTGTLILSGDGDASTTVGPLSTQHTFTNVMMSADGTPISLHAEFSDNIDCVLTNNNAGTAPAACSMAPACDITNLTVTNISTCNDNGTPFPGDDFFTADVTVTFVNPPATGTLELTEAGTASVGVGMLDGPTSHTFVGVVMLTDGLPINLMANFSADPACEYYEGEIAFKPDPCSCGPVINEVDYDQPGTDHAEFIELYNPCPNTINLDDYTVELVNGTNGLPYQTIQLPNVNLAAGEYYVICLNDVTTPNCDLEAITSIQNGAPDAVSLVYNNLGQVDGMSYEGDIAGVTEGEADLLNDDGSAEALGLSRFPNGVDTDWNNDDFSLRCTTPGVANSSSTTNCLNCGITSISVSNISACNDNGTPSTSDDTFTADVTVVFSQRPNTGTLNLTGDATASVNASGLSSPHTFTGVTMSADGSAISLTVTFSALPTCTLSNTNAGTAPAECSVTPPCNISDITVSNISACDNNGTPDPGDDVFTANVTVVFANPPATGTLNLSGDGMASFNAALLVGTSHTFIGVVMPSDGSAISLTATFSASPTCTLTVPNAGTAPTACSMAPACSITNISISNASSCNSQGTGNPADDTFTANVTVTFANPPVSGTLNLTGDGMASVSVVGLTSPHTFTGVTMSADGSAIGLTATFSADNACSLTNNNVGLAPMPCSQCSITSLVLGNVSSCNDNGTVDPNDDTFTANVTVNFVNPPFPGTIVLSGDANAVVAVGNGASQHILGGVVFSADGGPISLTAAFQENPSCTFTNTNLGTAPASCSPCNISGIVLSDMTSCNDNGTAHPGDDYFTADVTVNFQNPPSTGVLSLNGDGLGVVSVAGLGTSYTFQNVQMSADGSAISLSAVFSANPTCTFSNSNLGTAPTSCSPCGIESITVSNFSACDNQFTLDPDDDIFFANVTVNYFQAPGSGSLSVSGDAIASTNSFGPNSFTFVGLPFSADGTPITLTASFSANPACTLTTTLGLAPNNCSGDCFLEITDIIVENQSCPGAADGSITILANSSIGQLGYSIDGGANFILQNHFEQLAPGTYPILVQIFGDPTCSDTGVATVLPASPSELHTWYKDLDNDFYSDGVTVMDCEQPLGYKLAASLLGLNNDCNDNDPLQFPSQIWYKDTDGDGYSNGATLVQCSKPVGYEAASELSGISGDCNDNNAAIHPNAPELCNGIDDNCNGMVDENGTGGLTYNGNVVFTTQAQVNAFSACYSVINGNLSIQNAGITNLANLINLQSVTGNVTIKLTSLTSMAGLDGLTNIGGTLYIALNSKLATLDGLDALATVGGNLQIFSNLKLADCCAIYDLINGNGVGGNISIFSNKTGCDNVGQINTNCANNNLIAPPAGHVENTIQQSVEVFPNPASDMLNIRAVQAFEAAHVRLFDLQGRLVLQMKMNGGMPLVQIQTSNLPKGAYMLQVLVDGENFAQRVIVE